MQVSNETYTRLTEFADEFKKCVLLSNETRNLLFDMLIDEFGEDLTEQYANTFDIYSDDDDKY